jgi:poly-beta-1,6-N-acetyl-D-glucosamine synthase
VDSTVGATGAIYAIRRRLYEPIPEETILDDVLIPIKIAGKGYRVLFESDARAYDTINATTEAEFTRKVRTIAGNFQLLFTQRWLLNPCANRLWFQTTSHKFLRLLGPVCLLTALGSNLVLVELAVYRLFLVLQTLFYTAAIAGHMTRNPKKRATVLSVPYAFCLLNLATVMAFYRFVLGRQQVTWKRTTETTARS